MCGSGKMEAMEAASGAPPPAAPAGNGVLRKSHCDKHPNDDSPFLFYSFKIPIASDYAVTIWSYKCCLATSA